MKKSRISRTIRIGTLILVVDILQSLCFQRVIAQSFQNYDFEVISSENSQPTEWFIIEENGCSFASDSLTLFSGKLSFAIHPLSTGKPCSVTLLNDLEKQFFKNKTRIRVLMHVRSKDDDAVVSPFVKQLSSDGTEIQRTPGKTHKIHKINSTWEVVEFEEKIELSTEHMAFGVRTSSSNSIWIDAFEVYVDDNKLPDSKPPSTSLPTLAQLAWLNANVVGIDTFEVLSSNFLRDALKHSSFVALGEMTHGSSEIYQLKDQIVRYLVLNMNYQILALEIDVTDAEILNDYIINGTGDGRLILSQISYWPYRTEEFLGLLMWLKDYNNAREQTVRIVGFDIPSSEKTIEPILDFSIKIDKGLHAKVLELKDAFLQCRRGNLDAIAAFENQIEALSSYLQKDKSRLIANTNADVYARIVSRVISLKQTAMFYRGELKGENSDLRDKYMAENVSRLINENKQMKTIIWAHNAHISRAENYGAGMGRYLKDEHVIYSIGFSLGEGSFTGIDVTNPDRLGNYPIQPPEQDSYESFFIKSTHPNFFLNLKGLRQVSGNEWLFDEHKLRYIGAGISGRYQFARTRLTENFDAIIFVKDSSPSHLLK